MRRGLLLVVVLACFLLPARNASAAFGNDETIHYLQDVKLKGAKEEALYLGYMTKIFFIFAGVYVTDEGYVLGVKGESKRYYSMPTGEELARFQKAGLLPDPLPPYALGFWDYLIGYSLWLVIALTIAWMPISSRLKKRKAAAAAATAGVADSSPSAVQPPPPAAGPPT